MSITMKELDDLEPTTEELEKIEAEPVGDAILTTKYGEDWFFTGSPVINVKPNGVSVKRVIRQF
jgi:hypothetical protein